MQKRTKISDLFYCHHLGAGETDEKDIQKFEVRDEKGIGLLEYITECAFADENEGKMRTYLVRDRFSSDIVGYFSLKAGLVSYNEHEVVEINEKTGQPIVDEITGKMKLKRVFDTLPGVELADFAINQAFIDKHSEYKGVGLIIYDSFVLPIVVNTARNIGIKIGSSRVMVGKNHP